MVPIHSRRLLAWTLPTIAALLSYLWYKRKRIGAASDPGDKETKQYNGTLEGATQVDNTTITPPQDIENKPEQDKPKFSRSLSGVESTPIDIIIPRELRSLKNATLVISDEDLDVEIEKIKSMKNTNMSETIKSAKSSPVKVEPFECKIKTSPTPKTSSASSFKLDTPKKPPKKQKNNKKSTNAKPQQNVAVVEEKLNNLKVEELEKNNNEDVKRSTEINRRSSDRDSANHSPVDVMLASPSLSSISDNHSEGSNDSGKGGSDLATPPPSRTPGTESSSSGADNNDGATAEALAPAPSTSLSSSQMTIYEFEIPQSLVGKLIGKRGAFVNHIVYKTNAQVIVNLHPTNDDYKICSIEGNDEQIDKALKMIRDKFPLKRFPDITLEPIAPMHQIPTVPLAGESIYLPLVAGINNDTILSCMVTPGHLFLQTPTHPSFPSLNVLATTMNCWYSEVESPLLPDPIPENTVCAAYSAEAWFRAIIVSTDAETETSYVKFLDYGGYNHLPNSQLRQIRADFMLLPFQAAECFLANVEPVNGVWSEAAFDLVASLTKGSLIYTQVIEYTDEDVPLVHCYVVGGPQQLIFLNRELVNQGYARWISYEESSEKTGDDACAN